MDLDDFYKKIKSAKEAGMSVPEMSARTGLGKTTFYNFLKCKKAPEIEIYRQAILDAIGQGASKEILLERFIETYQHSSGLERLEIKRFIAHFWGDLIEEFEKRTNEN